MKISLAIHLEANPQLHHHLKWTTNHALHPDISEFLLDIDMMNLILNHLMAMSLTLSAMNVKVEIQWDMMDVTFFGLTVANVNDGIMYFVFVVETMPGKSLCV